MKLLLVFLTLSLTLTLAFAEIKLVSVLFRHGDRNPGNAINRCPKCCDPATNCDRTIVDNGFQPTGLGNLIEKGKERCVELGRYLRRNYGDLLGSRYAAQRVEALGSDVNRTRMSLERVLAGMYENESFEPVTTYVPKPRDTIFVPQMCETFTKEFFGVLDSPDFKKRMDAAGVSSFLPQLGNDMGSKAGKASLGDSNDLFHTFVAMEGINMALPSWASAVYPEGKLRRAAIMEYQHYGYNNLLRRLAGGVVLKKMIGDMRNVGTSQKKVHLYSGHEINVVMLLQALGLYDEQIPEYASAVIVELHEVRGRYSVKIRYYHGDPSHVEELSIPGCANSCSLDDFVWIYRDSIPTDQEYLSCRRVNRRGQVVYDPNSV